MPLAIDVLGAAVAVASAPLDIKVLRVNLTGDLTPLGTPTASFLCPPPLPHLAAEPFLLYKCRLERKLPMSLMDDYHMEGL